MRLRLGTTFAMVYLLMWNVKTYVLKRNVLLLSLPLQLTLSLSRCLYLPPLALLYHVPMHNCTCYACLEFLSRDTLLSMVHKLCFILSMHFTCRFPPVSIPLFCMLVIFGCFSPLWWLNFLFTFLHFAQIFCHDSYEYVRENVN